jgi:RHH-type transcriptional regulator, proline utilization regulon repressor / proline dehydrogenase / delta 1-pyrroline-5-carboxylate dehydrogenase
MSGRLREWIFRPSADDVPLAEEPLGGAYLPDETETVRMLVGQAALPARDAQRVLRTARELVETMRRNRNEIGGLDAFMGEYDLSSREGVVLMCLAEALLRIPDADVANRLIAEKLTAADFRAHLGGRSLFVNATTWALMLTGRVIRSERLERQGLAKVLAQLTGRLGEPVLRTALRQAMRILAHQFVMGRTIEAALERAGGRDERRYRYSFDMLGEAALTAADADRYMDAYAHAIEAVGAHGGHSDDPMSAPGVSVKLSALSPRFEFAHAARAARELAERLSALCGAARERGTALTVDAEEADRLELTLEVFRRVASAPLCTDWHGLGIAVQAYQKRAIHVIEWLEELGSAAGRVIPVRLVKGAYWDTEIKRAQEQGLAGYPVFTRKSSTDVSYLACARRLLQSSPHLYPQFATHNAHTAAWVMHVGAKEQFEFQRLHGMGEELYSEIVDAERFDRPCRVYAPVGSHADLLPYLVRRLLENGANTSFVNRIIDQQSSVEEIVENPATVTEALGDRLPHTRIPLPRDLYAPARRNSAGVNLADPRELAPLARGLEAAASRRWEAAPVIDGRRCNGLVVESLDPARSSAVVGEVTVADRPTALDALRRADEFHGEWRATAAQTRAECLRRAADLFEARRAELMALCIAEGGRTVADSLAEVREAVDFLRYYANECERLCAAPVELPGPTGESNALRLFGRGPFLCISPWNFPIAIFTGQVAAALAAGNTAIAKPALQTSLVGARVVELLFEAGIPAGALQFLPGDGALIGDTLLPDRRLAGVVFTGSTATAQRINRTLAGRDGPLAALIAETGGINAMLVDSSALTEQVVKDVIQSAFDSAGQRCSALRILCLQDETADDVLRMLRGAMDELVIGPPCLLSTDVGPIIDHKALAGLRDYVAGRGDRVKYRCELGPEHAGGNFFAPTLIELDRVADLDVEVFGPVLHYVRYRSDKLEHVIDEINGIGYGLTLGIHSRLDTFAERIAARARVGNVYVNRNMIGAVVGVQPFGGFGLSGTGPKAGGPHYLSRFTVEQSIAVNTAAIGGNATLLSLEELS